MASKVKNRLAVLNVVGLTSDLLKRGLPRLNQLADQGVSRLIQPALPAVTYGPIKLSHRSTSFAARDCRQWLVSS